MKSFILIATIAVSAIFLVYKSAPSKSSMPVSDDYVKYIETKHNGNCKHNMGDCTEELCYKSVK